MSILDWLAKREKKTQLTSEKLNIPGDLWIKCPGCSGVLFQKDLELNLKVCVDCGHHFRMSAIHRISVIFDEGSFVEQDAEMSSTDFLKFKDTQSYADRIRLAKAKTGLSDAIRIGQATLKTAPVNIGVMDFDFMGGSMGSVVGEKVTRIVEAGIQNLNPVIIFTASGGARMQEGIMSLMQMGKTSAALSRLSDVHVPFISVICDPTTGGTSASFAMLGDINIAEPGSLISFAGPRVIEQTIRQKLPKGFQRAEFLLEHGMLDLVVPRYELRDTLSDICTYLTPNLPVKKNSK
jgi:acetyl-CoA carboxylase carboxyl transferase subunit beta